MKSNPIRSFRDLDAWSVAMALAVDCYRLAKPLPAEERFELSAQIRRAAVSVPSNVAERHPSSSDGLFSRHVRVSLGSVGELETHMELAVRTGLLKEADVAVALEQLARTGQVLHGLARSIRAKRLRQAGGVALVLLAFLAAAW